jgi:hypothetical protein
MGFCGTKGVVFLASQKKKTWMTAPRRAERHERMAERRSPAANAGAKVRSTSPALWRLTEQSLVSLWLQVFALISV